MPEATIPIKNGKGDAPKPRLKGWMQYGADGKYEFHTIKAAPYPGGSNPAHIHGTLSAPGYTECWIENYLFEDDPLLPPKSLKTLHGTRQPSVNHRFNRCEKAATDTYSA